MAVIDLNSRRCEPLQIDFDDGHWKEFEKTEEFLKLVNPINFEFETNIETTKVMCRPISCYEDALFLRVTDGTWPYDWAVFHFLYSKEGNYYQFGSLSLTLWDINRAAHININKQSSTDYLKLFNYFFLMDEEDNSLFILDSVESEFVDLLPYSNEMERQNILNVIEPAIVKGPDKEGEYQVEHDVTDGESLYRRISSITKEGFMQDLEIIKHKLG